MRLPTAIPKTFGIVLLFTAGWLLLVSQPVLAQVILPADINLEISNLQEDRAFSVPKKILIAPIQIQDDTTRVRDEDWYKGLYYYLVANENHPGFTDIPFHYIVSETGKVFQGNEGGDERRITIDQFGTDIIVIGYLVSDNSTGFDVRSEDALAELVADLAGLHGIALSEVQVQGVQFVRNSTAQTVQLRKKDVFGLWKGSLDRVVEKARASYQPRKKQYNIKVLDVNLPEKQVDSGSTVNGTVLIKNTGKFGIYYDTLTEMIASRQGGQRSQFYLNDKWLSISQFSLMQADDVLLPDEEAEFEFTLATPLYFGELSENFVIKNALGQNLKGSSFNLKLNIKRPKGTIVQIRNTPVGYLRVRSEPYGLANNEIARVSPGQRFFQTDTNPAGWVRIRLNDGRQGWVSRQYISYV